jgi:hypothetical protein
LIIIILFTFQHHRPNFLERKAFNLNWRRTGDADDWELRNLGRRTKTTGIDRWKMKQLMIATYEDIPYILLSLYFERGIVTLHYLWRVESVFLFLGENR